MFGADTRSVDDLDDINRLEQYINASNGADEQRHNGTHTLQTYTYLDERGSSHFHTAQ